MDTNLFDRIFEVLLYTPAVVPYLAAFGVLVLCGLGLPIPEDLTLFVMGYLSYAGIADFKISVIVCLIGVLFGDSVIYFLGYHYGRRLAQKGPFKKILPPERMERTRTLFLKWGNKVIFVTRFMPGLRAPTYFSAGTLHLPYRVFIFYDGLAALLSVPALIGLTYYFGDHITAAVQVARKVQHGIALVIVGGVLLLVAKHYFMKKRSSR
jgi:membrane protein DedA with SNARE-associated domain